MKKLIKKFVKDKVGIRFDNNDQLGTYLERLEEGTDCLWTSGHRPTELIGAWELSDGPILTYRIYQKSIPDGHHFDELLFGEEEDHAELDIEIIDYTDYFEKRNRRKL